MRFRGRVSSLNATFFLLLVGVASASGCQDRVWDFGVQIRPPDGGSDASRPDGSIDTNRPDLTGFGGTAGSISIGGRGGGGTGGAGGAGGMGGSVSTCDPLSADRLSDI